MDELICVPAEKEHPLFLETTYCMFLLSATSFLDNLDMLHCLDFQLCDSKLLCLSEAKAALVQEIINHSVRFAYMI